MYSLGLDIGTNSIGWCAVGYNRGGVADHVLDIGSRIFSDGREPKSSASLAVARREKRAMRRSRDRYLRRRSALLRFMIEYGLMPLDKTERNKLEDHNPYTVRAQALDGQLPLHQIGRALFHLNQRRGFKSNRKTDKGDPESGKISLAVQKLREEMYLADARTYGEFLFKRMQQGLPLRIRMRDGEGPVKSNGEAMEGYPFYPDRAMLEDEFAQIWEKQAAFYPNLLTAERRAHLFNVIFYQRPLKAPEVGLCTLLGGDPTVPLHERERRIPKSDPLFQQSRLLQEVNALQIESGPGTKPHRLTGEQRDVLLMRMRGKKTVSFSSLRKTLKLGDSVFNKERAGRYKLLGDEVYAEMSNKTRFGPEWTDVPLERQREIVAKLRDEEDGDVLVTWLQENCDLDEERARAVASAKLPEGYGRLGETASRAIIRELTEHEIDGFVCVYSEAVAHAPELGHHSDERTGEIADELPYYGELLERHIIPGTGDPGDPIEKRIGKLTNPTVHIGLNQLRRLINAIIKKHGPPADVVVEIARDLKTSDRQKKDIQSRQNQNLQAAIKRSEKLEELGQADTGGNRALLKLWEDLNPDNPFDRRCIYTGEIISPTMLFTGEVDVDHILPWSRTLDDSNANKLICIASANRIKRNKTPFEAWGHDENVWNAILERAAQLPHNKNKRFDADAMEKYGGEDDFLARHLVDTQYLSRLAKTYLEVVAPGQVYVATGHLTAMLRRHWGLNSILSDHNYAHTVHVKNRKDHRHHAIDAAIMAVLSRGLINKIAREAGLREAQGVEDVVSGISEPWEGFRDDLKLAVNKAIVSHRPDHGTIGGKRHDKAFDQTAGRLHNETAYGLTGGHDGKGNTLVVRRIPVGMIKESHLNDSGAHIRDDELRARLRAATAGTTGKDFERAVLEFARADKKFSGMRHVRLIEPLTIIPITDDQGRAYKGYKGDANYRYDVWELPNGKWVADVISMFDAHSLAGESKVKREFPTARKIMRLHQGDMVAYDDDKHGAGIGRVVKFDQAGSVYLAAHNESGALKARDAASPDDDPFKYFKAAPSRLKKSKVRKVHINELGYIRDPGPRE